MHECDGYWPQMDLRAVRDALRLLRNQSGLSLDDIAGLDRSTVHRIENTKGDPDYKPELTSVALIANACGYTMARFFATLDTVTETLNEVERPDVLSELTDARKARQVAGFLGLRDEARQALALSGTLGPVQGRPGEPRRGTKKARRTTKVRGSRRSSVRGKADTPGNQ
jgi:transcriptional regulator with XRE-family HTH domain